MKRVALCLQYQGTDFCGWQRQSQKRTVQGALEEAVFKLEPSESIKVIAAGRTDAGVHAAAQVVHFDSFGPIPPKRWASALNGMLPSTIRATASVERPKNWHACFSAIYRRYRYTIYNGRSPNLFIAPWSWHRYQTRLDEKRMALVLDGLVGYHDFAAFQKTGSNRVDSFTTIQVAQVVRQGDVLEIEIQATGFLYGMVRLLVGQLVALGEDRISVDCFESRWKEKRRIDVNEAAPAKGLCFLRAGYQEQVFSEEGQFACFPRYFLESNDPPLNARKS